MSGVIQLPNGIKQADGTWTKEVELDEMTGVEEDILADMRRDPKNKGKYAKGTSRRMTEVLSRCTIRIGTDRRPTGKDRFNAGDHFCKQWEDAFAGDRTFALMRLRQLSLGNSYTTEEACPECGFEGKYTVDLSALPVNEISLEDVQKQRLVSLPSGKTAEWRMLRGLDEPLVEAVHQQQKSDMMTAMLFTKLVAIDGDKPSFEILKRMPSRDRNCLLQALDDNEGGVDVTLEHTCGNEDCGKDFKTSVNVGRNFFFPTVT